MSCFNNINYSLTRSDQSIGLLQSSLAQYTALHSVLRISYPKGERLNDNSMGLINTSVIMQTLFDVYKTSLVTNLVTKMTRTTNIMWLSICVYPNPSFLSEETVQHTKFNRRAYLIIFLNYHDIFLF